MDEASIAQYITTTFAGVEILVADGSSFFFYGADRKMPFVTIVTDDQHDSASHLNRPGVFRVNIGVRKETYESMFGAPPKFPAGGGVVDTGHDFTALDQIMPHPIYAAMAWVCVLNPSEATFESLR